MSMQKEHQWLLLESTGELSRWNQRRLQRALRNDPDLQRYAQELQELTRLEQSSVPEPPAFNPCIIEHQARRQRRASTRPDFMTLWQPALAYGAIAIALGMTIVYLGKNWEQPGTSLAQQNLSEDILAWEDPYLDVLENLNVELAQLDEDPLATDSNDGWNDVDNLARELLALGESS